MIDSQNTVRRRSGVWLTCLALSGVVFAASCGRTTRDEPLPHEGSQHEMESSSGGTIESNPGTDTGGRADGASGGAPISMGGHAGDDAGPGECTAPRSAPTNVTPVEGTIRGSELDAILCQDRVSTIFLGPEGSTSNNYTHSFNTTAGDDGPSAGAFLIRAPSDVVSLSLGGGVGAPAAEPGTYSSTDNCGWLRVEVALAIPSDVVCEGYGSCPVGCEPMGELGICQRGNPKSSYSALAGGPCGDDPASGQWELTLSEVFPVMDTARLHNFSTHGRLTATLVNEDDPSDTLELDLDF